MKPNNVSSGTMMLGFVPQRQSTCDGNACLVLSHWS